MDRHLSDYVEEHSSPEKPVLARISRDTYLNVLNAHQLSGHIQGLLLSMLSRMIRPKQVLEIGTFTGYSALCLAAGADKVVTVERNDELADRIRRNLAFTPEGGKVELHIGDFKQVVKELQGEFQLVFIDGDKREYLSFLELVYPLVPSGGWILADNTLWGGHIIDPAYDKDSQTVALREFNDAVAADPRFEVLLLPVRDGLSILRKLG